MHVENGQLVLTDHECMWCDTTGKTDEIIEVACSKCNGTGRGPRGGRRGCKQCHGDGKTWKRSGKKITCSKCDGTTREADDYYDHVPFEVWRELRFEVVATMHRQTFYEAHIGAGCYSHTDYGDWRHGTASDLIEKVRNRDSGVQACKLVKSPGYRTYLEDDDPRREDPDPTMPDFVGIFLNDNGYTVAAVHGQEVNV